MSSGRFATSVVLVLALVGAAGAFFFPLPRTVRCEYELVAAGKTTVAAPFDGVLREVADAGAVETGAPLARYDDSALVQRRVQLEGERAVLVKKLESPMDPSLREAVRVAEEDVQKNRRFFASASRRFKPYAKVVLDNSERKLAAAREAARPVPSAQLEEPLARLNAELAALDEQRAASVISAPVSGEFAPSTKPGDAVSAKQVIGVLVDGSTLAARVTLPPGEVAKQGRRITLVLPFARKTWALTEDGANGVATVEVDNRDGALEPGAKGVAELEGEPRPFFPR